MPSSHVRHKVNVEFHFRAACSWISRTSCPVRFSTDFPWDPAVTATVTRDRSVPLTLLPLHSRCSSQVPPYGSQGFCAPASARSPPCVQFHTLGSVWSLIFLLFLECVGCPHPQNCAWAVLSASNFPSRDFLSSTHSSRFSLNVIMQRAFHKPLTLVFWSPCYDLSNYTLLLISLCGHIGNLYSILVPLAIVSWQTTLKPM